MTQHQYAKLTFALAHVVQMLRARWPQVDPMPRGDDLFLLLKPVIDYYLFKVDEESMRTLDREKQLITRKMRDLNEDKKLYEEKRKTFENHISRFSPEEGESIRSKIEDAQAQVDTELFYQKETLIIKFA
uniref:Uncharacterized protein n=1 Tax=Corydalis conspersa TaxID=2182691 RepID=A0A6G8J3B5_9MAGN|nr:hypothetical protein [Corydalis conspersa]QIM61598.1 hypothetical protein [Corydalis conspersa]